MLCLRLVNGVRVQTGKRWSVLAQIAEVDALIATGSRNGSTIMSELRCGWSGERLGFDYAGQDKRIILHSGGLGPEVGWTLRAMSAPGAELILPVVAPQFAVMLGERVRSRLSAWGVHSVRAAETWSAYVSLADPGSREAFLRTLRSVVDYRGQAVSAFNRLSFASGLPALLIWGADDRIIPASHGKAAQLAMPDSRLRVLPGVGHYPYLEAADEVVDAIDEFFTTAAPWQGRHHRMPPPDKDAVRDPDLLFDNDEKAHLFADGPH